MEIERCSHCGGAGRGHVTHGCERCGKRDQEVATSALAWMVETYKRLEPNYKFDLMSASRLFTSMIDDARAPREVDRKNMIGRGDPNRDAPVWDDHTMGQRLFDCALSLQIAGLLTHRELLAIRDGITKWEQDWENKEDGDEG